MSFYVEVFISVYFSGLIFLMKFRAELPAALMIWGHEIIKLSFRGVRECGLWQCQLTLPQL